MRPRSHIGEAEGDAEHHGRALWRKPTGRLTVWARFDDKIGIRKNCETSVTRSKGRREERLEA